jgi:voltage-gated potassium channel
MMKHSILDGFLKGRFSVMLVFFLVYFIVVPVVPEKWVDTYRIPDILSMLVITSCLRAISLKRQYYIFMVIFTVIILLLGGSEIVHRAESLNFITLLLSLKLIYMLMIFLSIMRYVLDDSPVTADKVYGALSSYFLMGLIWAVVFAMFYHINPDSFNVSPESDKNLWTIYFSFTTLSTLGYGDITPQTVAAQSYAVMEAVCGQIFIGVIVARLIALQISTPKPEQ